MKNYEPGSELWVNDRVTLFEDCLRDELRPRIETFMRGCPSERCRYLFELLFDLEIDHNREYGLPIRADSYLLRFPEFEKIVNGYLPDPNECGIHSTVAHGIATIPRRDGDIVSEGLEAFGDYTLICQLGRGAMGVVHKAREPAPTNRIVALKRLGFKNPEPYLLERFERESKAIANLEHDHIVRVYNVGSVKGRPFISMQYVEGETLYECVERAPLDNRRAAVYIEQVARAVHYAHCRGVLHRDLKPGNILIDSVTDRVFVTDFGLAKFLEDDHIMTQASELLGTPAYMSPEQADSSAVDVTSDVYGLGATLYHLLSGRPPFEADTTLEVLHQAKYDVPMSPRLVNSTITKDLETICLKCIEKDPRRRYDSALAVADELQRFLRGEPIQARPISSADRLVRWCRRKPILATISGVAVALFIAVLAALGWGFVSTSAALARVTTQERRTRQNFDMAREAVDKALMRVSNERRLKQFGLEDFRLSLVDIAHDFYERFVQQFPDDKNLLAERSMAVLRLAQLREQSGRLDQAAEAYESALAMWMELSTSGSDDYLSKLASAHQGLGGIHDDMERLEAAETEYDRAKVILIQLASKNPRHNLELAGVYQNLGRLYQRQPNRRNEAEAAYSAGLDLAQQLASDSPNNSACQLVLAINKSSFATMYENDLVKAEEMHASAIETYERILIKHGDLPDGHEWFARSHLILSNQYTESGRLDEALSHGKVALEVFETLVAAHPRVPRYAKALQKCYNDVGRLHSDTGDLRAAEDMFSAAVSIGETRHPPELAISYYELGRLQEMRGMHEKAEEALLSCLEIDARFRQEKGRDPKYMLDLGRTHSLLGRVYAQMNQSDDAKTQFFGAKRLFAQVLDTESDNIECRRNLAHSHHNLAHLLNRSGELDSAEAESQQAVKLYSSIDAEEPGRPENLLDHALALELLGDIQLKNVQLSNALTAFEESVVLRRRLLQLQPENSVFAESVAQLHTRMGYLHEMSAQPQLALKSYTLAIEIRESIINSSESTKLALSQSYWQAGVVCMNTGQLPDTLTWLDKAIPPLESMSSRYPDDNEVRGLLVEVYGRRAYVLGELTEHRDSVSGWTDAIRLANASERPSLNVQRALSLARSGECGQAIKQIEKVRSTSPDLTEPMLYNMACVYSQAYADVGVDAPHNEDVRADVAARYANVAISHLGELRRRGFFDNVSTFQMLSSDDDLAPIRHLDDFRSFVKQIAHNHDE